MSERSTHKIWQSNWGYPESFAIVVGVVIIGLSLQLCVGAFDFYLLANPVNYIAGLVTILVSILVGITAHKSNFARWISSVPLSVALILTTLILTIIMGLTPQIAEGAQTTTPLGFEAMTKNWAFVMLYGATLIALGSATIKRLLVFRIKDIGFYLNHIGLWLLLAASGLGYADMERYIMYVSEGETQWRVYNESGEIKELPIAISLEDFDMDVYPPKLTIIDRSTGEAQPTSKPHYFQIDNDIKRASINGWEVENLEYIHTAVRSSDSTYREVPMPGATPAVKVRASRGGQSIEGWVCGGNQSQSYMTLPLSEEYCIVMTAPEPSLFTSKVEVFTESGKAVSTTIEVNHPLRIDSWTIYQYGYDNNAGRLSSYSSFELVYDPWIIPVYIGIIMMMLGALTLIVGGRKTKRDDHNVE